MTRTVLSVTMINSYTCRHCHVHKRFRLSHLSVYIFLQYANTVLLCIMILSVLACVLLSVVPFKTLNAGRNHLIIKLRNTKFEKMSV